jgi:hypothetical protein
VLVLVLVLVLRVVVALRPRREIEKGCRMKRRVVGITPYHAKTDEEDEDEDEEEHEEEHEEEEYETLNRYRVGASPRHADPHVGLAKWDNAAHRRSAREVPSVLTFADFLTQTKKRPTAVPPFRCSISILIQLFSWLATSLR